MTTPERPHVTDVASESSSATNGAAAESAPTSPPATGLGPARRMDVVDLNAGFGTRTIIQNINLAIEPNAVTALIGPSGCGKSTLLRCLNAMHSTAKTAFATGQILLDGDDINARGVDPVLVRRRVGMVFQRPNPFPTMSIYDNVAAGLRLTAGKRSGRHHHDEVVERALRQADLWSEVKDRLRNMGGALSGGQQQRLCIARALAVEPEVLLMDEPCSALDPISTAKIEDTIHSLRERYTIVIVTHNMQQAARVSNTTAFMTILEAGQPGELVETGPTASIFDKPTNEVTGAYVSGRFG
jgi:phosphate transport system ATP-binding protein